MNNSRKTAGGWAPLPTALLIMVMLAGILQDARAQELTRIAFAGGGLDAEIVPYGRPFMITGSMHLPQGRARIVVLTVMEDSSKPCPSLSPATPISYHYIYEASSRDDDTTFAIVVDPLEFDASYRFCLTFLSPRTLSAQESNTIIFGAVTDLRAIWKAKEKEKKELTSADVRKAIAGRVGTLLGTSGGFPAHATLTIDRDNKKVQLTGVNPGTPDPNYHISLADSAIIAEYAAKTAELETSIGGRNDMRNNLAQLIAAPTPPTVATVQKNLLAALKAKGAKLEYTQADVAAIGASSGIENALPPGILKLTQADAPKIPKGTITPSDIEVLKKLTFARYDVMAAEQLVNDYQREVARLLKALEASLVTIVNAYVHEATVGVTRYAFTTETELQTILVGTTFGVGGTMLGMAGSEGIKLEGAEPGVFQYGALTFHLGAVDKDLPDPWLRGYYSRFSILVGFAIAPSLRYKGQELQSIGGMMPVLGISYALDRYISVDIAAIGFQQPSLSPATAATQPRVAPVVGFTFDANLLERLRKALTPITGE